MGSIVCLLFSLVQIASSCALFFLATKNQANKNLTIFLFVAASTGWLDSTDKINHCGIGLCLSP
jgi:hypothetical protein